MFGWRGFKLILHQDVYHVGFKLFIFYEFGGLIFLQLHDNIVTHLHFGGCAQQVPHNVGDFTLVNEVFTLMVNDIPRLSHLLSVELLLAGSFLRVLRRWQHIF